MAQTSRPWQSTTPGDAGPYSATDWATVWQSIIGWGGKRANVGVFLGTGTQPNEGLRVQAQAPASTSVDVLTGAALVQGIAYLNTATVSFVIAANSSGNARIDTVVVQADYTLQTARLALKQGTPAATPAPPALTQTPSVLWEIPVADIAVANGFATITQANITSRREWVNAPPGVYLDNVLNNSGVTLVDGDIVVWDSTADRAITTTTTAENNAVAGVWRGRTDTANYGRVQTAGVGYVNANAAITRGNLLATSTTAKQAGVQVTTQAQLARALETTSGSGLVLCQIQIIILGNIATTDYCPYAYPMTFSPSSTLAVTLNLPAAGGSVAIPFAIPSHMQLDSVTIRNNDAATTRTWGWDLYEQSLSTQNVLTRVANSTADDTFTPGAASNRTVNAAAVVDLKPGTYWLVIQNRHATNAFSLGTTGVGLVIGNSAQTKTTTNPNGATLDFTAATWTAQTAIMGARLNGRVFGLSTLF